MKCSIIIAVLDSHEIFRRQMRRLKRIVPPDFEVIILDDGSEIPLRIDGPVGFPFRLLHTGDKRPWTNNLARNRGAELASGEYLLMTDIDHVLTPEIFGRVRRFRGDMLKFHRQVADLDEQGEVRNPRESVVTHQNTFVIRKSLFLRMGGYHRQYIGYGSDGRFFDQYQRLVRLGHARPIDVAETVYVVTEGKWFHKLKRQIGRGSPPVTRLPLVFSASPVRPADV